MSLVDWFCIIISVCDHIGFYYSTVLALLMFISLYVSLVVYVFICVISCLCLYLFVWFGS